MFGRTGFVSGHYRIRIRSIFLVGSDVVFCSDRICSDRISAWSRLEATFMKSSWGSFLRKMWAERCEGVGRECAIEKGRPLCIDCWSYSPIYIYIYIWVWVKIGYSNTYLNTRIWLKPVVSWVFHFEFPLGFFCSRGCRANTVRPAPPETQVDNLRSGRIVIELKTSRTTSRILSVGIPGTFISLDFRASCP